MRCGTLVCVSVYVCVRVCRGRPHFQVYVGSVLCLVARRRMSARKVGWKLTASRTAPRVRVVCIYVCAYVYNLLVRGVVC